MKTKFEFYSGVWLLPNVAKHRACAHLVGGNLTIFKRRICYQPWASHAFQLLPVVAFKDRLCVCAPSLIHVWLCEPMDCSPPVFSVHGIILARILEWVAVSYSRGSSWRIWTWSNLPLLHILYWLVNSWPLRHLRSPPSYLVLYYVKQRRTKEPLDESERGEWKRWLKAQHL